MKLLMIFMCNIVGGTTQLSSFQLSVAQNFYLINETRLTPERHGGFSSAKFPGGVLDVFVTADPRSPGARVQVYYPHGRLTYLCR